MFAIDYTFVDTNLIKRVVSLYIHVLFLFVTQLIKEAVVEDFHQINSVSTVWGNNNIASNDTNTDTMWHCITRKKTNYDKDDNKNNNDNKNSNDDNNRR